MEKIIETFKGHIRVNEATKTIEVFDEYGVKMRLEVSEDAYAEFLKYFPKF